MASSKVLFTFTFIFSVSFYNVTDTIYCDTNKKVDTSWQQTHTSSNPKGNKAAYLLLCSNEFRSRFAQLLTDGLLCLNLRLQTALQVQQLHFFKFLTTTIAPVFIL